MQNLVNLCINGGVVDGFTLWLRPAMLRVDLSSTGKLQIEATAVVVDELQRKNSDELLVRRNQLGRAPETTLMSKGDERTLRCSWTPFSYRKQLGPAVRFEAERKSLSPFQGGFGKPDCLGDVVANAI